MNKDKALKLALQLVSNLQTHSWTVADEQLVITAIKEALAQPQQSCYCPNCEALGKELAALKAQSQQEPVAWMKPHEKCDRACIYLCTKAFTKFPDCVTPPQRTWVGLTNEELFVYPRGFHGCMRYVETKLKEKNT